MQVDTRTFATLLTASEHSLARLSFEQTKASTSAKLVEQRKEEETESAQGGSDQKRAAAWGEAFQRGYFQAMLWLYFLLSLAEAIVVAWPAVGTMLTVHAHTHTHTYAHTHTHTP